MNSHDLNAAMNADPDGWREPWRKHTIVLREYVQELREYIAELQQVDNSVQQPQASTFWPDAASGEPSEIDKQICPYPSQSDWLDLSGQLPQTAPSAPQVSTVHDTGQAHSETMQAGENLNGTTDEKEPKPDWEGFARAIMDAWPHGDVDGGTLHDTAEHFGLLRKEPGGYDPDKHGDDFADVYETGDEFFVPTYPVRRRGRNHD